MSQPSNRQERDHTSFIDSPKRANESSRAVVVENTTANPVPVTSDPAENPVIYNVSVTANTQESQLFTDGTKKILIKPRDVATMKVSYDNTFSSFMTVPRGNAFEITNIVSSSLTIYFEADKSTVIEIEEWS